MDVIKERDANIIRAKISGKTYQAIAEEHNISAVRVRQIVDKIARRGVRYKDVVGEKIETISELRSIVREKNIKTRVFDGNEKSYCSKKLFEIVFSERARSVLFDNGFDCPFAVARFFDIHGKDAFLQFKNCGKKTQREIRDAICMYMRDFHIRNW